MPLIAQVPGGPGLPAGCGTPVLDAQGPLNGIPPANRGATAEICPPTDLGSITVPVVDARSWAGCVIARSLVVTLGRKHLRKRTGPHSGDVIEERFVMPRLRALIKWGLGGSAAEFAEIDWQHGTQLSIAAEYIEVSARYDVVVPPWQANEFVDPCDLPIFEVSAGFGDGLAPHNSNPARLTELVQILTPGDKVRVNVPDFAISFSVLLHSASTGALVEQVAFGTSYRTKHNFTAPTSNVGQYNVENATPLWNGAEFLEVTNTNIAGPLLASVVFGLAL